ncbi:MAG: hypothetical protein R3C56_08945 [Pirellulaceae bacterium]
MQCRSARDGWSFSATSAQECGELLARGRIALLASRQGQSKMLVTPPSRPVPLVTGRIAPGVRASAPP